LTLVFDRLCNSVWRQRTIPPDRRYSPFLIRRILQLSDNDLKFRGYIPGLDVLRGMAIAFVLTYHGVAGRTPWENWHGLARVVVYLSFLGLTGVDLFFVLSGFLITGILLDSAQSHRYYRSFYRNRMFRILPAYGLMLVVLLATHTINGYFLLAALLFIANMASLVGAHTTQYPSLWSLAVEEQFYLLWPTIVRHFSPRTLVRLIITYLVASPFVRMTVAHYRPHLDMIYKLWGNADWLLAGALVAITLRTGVLNRDNIRRWMLTLGAMVAVSGPICIYRDLHHLSNYEANPFYRLPFLLLYLLLLLVVISRNLGSSVEPSPLCRAFSFLGYISYGLYLVHSLIFQKFDHAVGSTWLGSTATLLPILVSFVLSAVLAIAVAWLSRRFFESFFLNLRKRSPAPSSLPIASANVSNAGV
jgi:peptidoglycan/LPS O-acetylase OafA/YrhL